MTHAPVRRLALAAATLAATTQAQTPLTTELVADGFADPIALTQAPGDRERLFVVEQRGKIRVVEDGAVLPTPFLDITSLVSQTHNRGLLGMEFHPEFQTNGYFYLNITKVVPQGSHPTVILRYSVSEDPAVADATSAVEILEIAQPHGGHNAGDLKFGPDGYLYIPLGDGGPQEDPSCRAQNGLEYMGKILRIDVDGGFPYAVPASNPYLSDPTHLDEIWAKGLRQPWRFSFDRETGDLYLGDVGQYTREEINFQPPGVGAVNYGWKVMEGTTCFDADPLDVDCPEATSSCFGAEYTDPIHELSTDDHCAIIGGFVYRGCAVPDLQGSYFFADHCTAAIWSLRYDGGNLTELVDRTAELAPAGGPTIDLITSFGQDTDGELYVLDRGGEVFKIVPDAPAPYADLGFALTASTGETPRLDVCGLLEPASSADIRLTSAPPSSPALLVVSLNELPVPVLSGVLVPSFPFVTAKAFTTDAAGELVFSAVDGGLFGAPLELVLQWLIADPGLAPDQIAFSNAIRAVWQ